MTIEVSERLLDYRYVTVADATGRAVQERRPKYHAQVQGQPGLWACGDTRAEAIGDLIAHHPEMFGAQIEHLGRLAR